MMDHSILPVPGDVAVFNMSAAAGVKNLQEYTAWHLAISPGRFFQIQSFVKFFFYLTDLKRIPDNRTGKTGIREKSAGSCSQVILR